MKREEFDSIYREYAEIILKIARTYIKDIHVASDLTQIAFLRFYHHMEHVEEAKILSWLAITVKRLCLTYFEQDEKVTTVDWEELDSYSVDLPDNNPEEEILEKERTDEIVVLNQEIFEALYEKNTRWYETVTLVYVLGKPQKEVAKEMEITLGVLESILYRAKEWIKKNYSERYGMIMIK